MFDYQDRYLKLLMAQNFSKSTLKAKCNTFKLFESFLKIYNYDNNAKAWDSKIFEYFYDYLKSYTYKIADNRVIGYQKDKSKRKYIKKKLKEEVILNHVTNLKQLVKYLLESNIIYTNPFEKLKFRLSKKNRIKEDITEKEINELTEAINEQTYLGYRDRTIIEVIYGTGIRLKETETLNIYDIDFKEGALHVRQGKGKKDRLIPIGEVALSYVKEYMTEVRKYLLSVENISEEALFLNGKGKRLTDNSIGRIIRDYARRVGIYHVTTHKLRHSFALHMMRKGCDIRYIQEILGHENLRTTEIYTEVYDYDLREKILKYHPCGHEMKMKIDVKNIKEICNKG